MSRNANTELLRALSQISITGTEIIVRGNKTKEILNHVVEIERPLERCFIWPHRNDNIFTKIAETMWVLAGRNDLEFLTHYLPQAPTWSDDGKTWRAGYGPRLREWEGTDNKIMSAEDYSKSKDICVSYTDQIKQIVELLRDDPDTRRAVMTIYDPAKDFWRYSKDIPCNNWIHFIIRDNKLHMNVAVRSQDAIWGLSGINTFEWSVLHQMMAFWVGVEIGSYTQFVTSLHVYERHFEKMEQLISNIDMPDATIYEQEYEILPLNFNTPFDPTENHLYFDKALEHMFDIEENLCRNNNNGHPPESLFLNSATGDMLLDTFIEMLWIYNAWLQHPENIALIVDAVNMLKPCDLKFAAIEYFLRKKSAGFVLDMFVIPPSIRDYLATFFVRPGA